MNKYFIITYGCQMNVHDSEKIAGLCEKMGYKPSQNAENADFIIFNTCCIRDNAEMRAYGNIGALKSAKKRNPSLIIAVVGCMMQQVGVAENLIAKYPFVDIALGTHDVDKLPLAVEELRRNKHFVSVSGDTRPAINEDIPIARSSGTNAWIDIIYGCNNFCTYCIVPYVRGRERSRSMDVVLADVNNAVKQGYKEITLLGQNVDSYGSDFDNCVNFATLLENISHIEGKFRVRFMTSHPKDFNKKVIDIISASRNICHNIHLPVQSGSNNVLRLMNRKYTAEQYMDIIRYTREMMPDVGITSDIMVGFPGETEEDFADTLNLVKQARFSSAFTFVYSPRNGTPAAKMPQIDDLVKKRRITELVKLQNSITKEISSAYFGKVYEVLAEDSNPKFPGTLCGRTDNGRLVTFDGNAELIGSFQNVLIENSRSASLFGHIIAK